MCRHPPCCHAVWRHAAGAIVDRNASCDLVRDFAYYLSFYLLPLLRSTSPVCLLRPEHAQVLKSWSLVFVSSHLEKSRKCQIQVEINLRIEMSFCQGPLDDIISNSYYAAACLVFLWNWVSLRTSQYRPYRQYMPAHSAANANHRVQISSTIAHKCHQILTFLSCWRLLSTRGIFYFHENHLICFNTAHYWGL